MQSFSGFVWVHVCCHYLDPLLMAVHLQGTAAVLRERRHMEVEGRRSAFPLLQKVHNMLTLIRPHTLNYYEPN